MSTPNSTTDDNDAAANQDGAPPSGVQPRAVKSPMTSDWSSQLTSRFGIVFDDELRSWWDEKCHQVAGLRPSGTGEFRYPASPQTLLSSVPDPIWPPFMPPNFLPLIGNGAGDWLCLRLLDPDVAAQSGIASDICQWYHGGGDWLPWGRRLSEALLFDGTLARLPQPDRRHAEPAAEESGAGPQNSTAGGSIDWLASPWGHWIAERLPAAMQIDWNDVSDPHQLANEMLQRGLCEVPVRCQLVIDALSTQLTGKVNPNVAQELGLVWNDWMRWCFDLRTMPGEIAARLQSAFDLSESCFDPAQQRWDDVARHANAVAASHPDLGWSHDLLGYVRWRDGERAGADDAFEHAIRCSVFTDQSVRLRTHWATSSDGVAKFSARFLGASDSGASDASRLSASGQEFVAREIPEQLGRVPNVISRSQLLQHFCRGVRDGSASVRQHYSQMLVDAACEDHPPATRARLLYAAGWDLGAEPLHRYGELLDRYLAACEQAGWAAHHQLASVHRQGLKARYNL